MQKEVLLSSAYLAPVVYYTKLYAYEKAYIERYDHYMKQTYRNRCVIASANGPLALTIPTEKADEAKCLMKDVRISDHGNWRHTHWNAEMSDEGCPYLRPWQLAAYALERFRSRLPTEPFLRLLCRRVSSVLRTEIRVPVRFQRGTLCVGVRTVGYPACTLSDYGLCNRASIGIRLRTM